MNPVLRFDSLAVESEIRRLQSVLYEGSPIKGEKGLLDRAQWHSTYLTVGKAPNSSPEPQQKSRRSWRVSC